MPDPLTIIISLINLVPNAVLLSASIYKCSRKIIQFIAESFCTKREGILAFHSKEWDRAFLGGGWAEGHLDAWSFRRLINLLPPVQFLRRSYLSRCCLSSFASLSWLSWQVQAVYSDCSLGRVKDLFKILDPTDYQYRCSWANIITVGPRDLSHTYAFGMSLFVILPRMAAITNILETQEVSRTIEF